MIQPDSTYRRVLRVEDTREPAFSVHKSDLWQDYCATIDDYPTPYFSKSLDDARLWAETTALEIFADMVKFWENNGDRNRC